MSVNRTPYMGSYGSQVNQYNNPWSIKTDYGKEDISWLLK